MENGVFKYKRVALQPKFFLYKVNGTGRDLYIRNHNKITNEVPPRWNFDLKTKKLKDFKIQPKIVNYRQDDTGRDYYIIKNNGGYFKNREVGKPNGEKYFYSILR